MFPCEYVSKNYKYASMLANYFSNKSLENEICSKLVQIPYVKRKMVPV